MIDNDKCSEEIYKYGESCGLRTDLTKQKANEFCEKLTNDSEEYAYDWHYIAGCVQIKRLKKSLLGYQDEVQPSEVQDD